MERIRWKKNNVCSCAGDAEAKKGRAQQQATTQRVYWRWPGCHELVVGVERGQEVEDGKLRWLGPASIARHNLAPLSIVQFDPTNDVLVAPCLATTSAAFSPSAICCSSGSSLLPIRVFLLLRLYSPLLLPRIARVQRTHSLWSRGTFPHIHTSL